MISPRPRRMPGLGRRLASKQLFAARCVSRDQLGSLDEMTFGRVDTRRRCAPSAGFTCAGHIPLLGPSSQKELSVRQARTVREMFPDCRTRRFNVECHRLNRASLHRLHSSLWPTRKSDGSKLWPSSPTLFERLEMIRIGYTGPDPRPYGPTVRVGLKEFNGDHRLASAVIRQYVIGLRSDMEVPEKYFGHFRYSHGFLILTAPYVPIGLARFLASLWCTDPHSLWLTGPGSLKQCLRTLPKAFYERNRDDKDSTFSFELDEDD